MNDEDDYEKTADYENKRYMFSMDIAELCRYSETTALRCIREIDEIFLKDYHMRMQRLHDRSKKPV